MNIFFLFMLLTGLVFTSVAQAEEENIPPAKQAPEQEIKTVVEGLKEAIAQGKDSIAIADLVEFPEEDYETCLALDHNSANYLAEQNLERRILAGQSWDKSAGAFLVLKGRSEIKIYPFDDYFIKVGRIFRRKNHYFRVDVPPYANLHKSVWFGCTAHPAIFRFQEKMGADYIIFNEVKENEGQN
ncbi:MAG: hypothetical protein ACQEQL_00805 [Pseudomonadota bacterium]